MDEDIRMALERRNRQMTYGGKSDKLILAGAMSRISAGLSRKKARRKLVGFAAAVIFLAVAVGLGWYFNRSFRGDGQCLTPTASERIIAELERAGYKGEAEVMESSYTLPDGTHCFVTRVTVKLDPGSDSRGMGDGHPIAFVRATYDSIVGKMSTRCTHSTELHFSNGIVCAVSQ